MEKKVYEEINKIFIEKLSSKDTKVEVFDYSYYLRKDGRRNKTIKDFRLFITLNTLMRINNSHNLRVVGENLVNVATCIDDICKEHEDVIFHTCRYNDKMSRLEVYFCPASERAFKLLSENSENNNFEVR